MRSFQPNLFRADSKVTLLYCYWVPVEVSTESIHHALSAYGQVIDIQHQVHAAFPTTESGIRLVCIKLCAQVPEVVRILNFPCKFFLQWSDQVLPQLLKDWHFAKDCPKFVTFIGQMQTVVTGQEKNQNPSLTC